LPDDDDLLITNCPGWYRPTIFAFIQPNATDVRQSLEKLGEETIKNLKK
jgi:hypothetical protein